MTYEYVEPLLEEVVSSPHKARDQYREQALQDACIPGWVTPESILLTGWVSICIEFKMLTPWYSRDDRPFHAMDNPVRRDRVLGTPFMAASSWKGLLRWTCDMDEAISQDKKTENMLHLFGPDNDTGTDDTGWEGQRGALVFRPTWFRSGSDGLIGFEVINPHDRAKRAGKGPIYYEVVKPEAWGGLQILYAPSPGLDGSEAAPAVDALRFVLRGARSLLETYGISAKRTAGWGLTRICGVQLERKGKEPLPRNPGAMDVVLNDLPDWLAR